MSGHRIAVLADGHITQDDSARAETLARSLDGLPASVVALYVLGDLFEVWLGVRQQEPAVAVFTQALGRARGRGIKVGYVEGNRDFGIARGRLAHLFDVASSRVLLERFGSKTYHLTHGDLVNTADRQYRFWRSLSKGLIAPAALRVLPVSTALALAARLEQAFRPTNLRHKRDFPRAACESYARRAVHEGADVVVVGHFHRAVHFEVEAGGRRGSFVSLPFWHQEPRLVTFDEQGEVEGLEP